MSQPGPKRGKRYPPYDPVAFKRALAAFDAAAAAGTFDTDDFPDLPDLPPAPADGEDTVALLVPKRVTRVSAERRRPARVEALRRRSP